MTTLQVKMNVPENRHLSLDLDLPLTIEPGEAEILLVIQNTKKENNPHVLTKEQLLEKLDNGPIWSDEDFAGFKEFRREIKKWQPDEF